MITLESNIEFLENFNKWRRGDTEINQPDPCEIGAHIEYAIATAELLEAIYADNNSKTSR